MMENEQSTAINPSEAVEEKVSLSDRFGLWLGFHKCSQEDYLQMIGAYADHFKLDLDRAQMHHEALEWATTRGARSGRVAWQYVQDLPGLPALTSSPCLYEESLLREPQLLINSGETGMLLELSQCILTGLKPFE